MNKLKGIIHSLESSPCMSIVEVTVKGDIFSTIVLETPQSNPSLKAGNPVTLLFKEPEVSLAKNLSGMISLRNRFPSTRKSIQREKILTHVVLDYRGGEITSIISSRSAQRLNLQVGDTIEWLVKTNEVTLLFEK